MIDSRCGLHCTECEYKESGGCNGCKNMNGKLFWGECPVAVCCQNKGLTYCGECPDIPCELLTMFSCDPEHGDNPPGARIEQCKKWQCNQKQKVLVIFASHRLGGENGEIENAVKRNIDQFDYDFVHFANTNIHSCMDCRGCSQDGHCILPQTEDDRFQELFDKMVGADAIFIISPVYASIPSRLTALFERLTSVLYYSGLINTDANPLINKKAAIFSYNSCGICDASSIKLVFDKFVMKNYRFDYSTYEYLNNISNPKEIYKNTAEYVLDTLKKLKSQE